MAEVKEQSSRGKSKTGKKKLLSLVSISSIAPRALLSRAPLCSSPGAHSGREAAFAETDRREVVAAAGAAAAAERRVAAIFFFIDRKRGRAKIEEGEGRGGVIAARAFVSTPKLFFFIFFSFFFSALLSRLFF